MAMIVEEIICGYLVAPEQLVKFAEENDLPWQSSDVLVRDGILRQNVGYCIEATFRKLHPFIIAYPRGVHPRKMASELLFPTRQVFEVPHTLKFTETPRDKEILERIMNVHPRIRALLENAQFVNVPNPANDMMLPGEEPYEYIDSAEKESSGPPEVS